MFPDNTSTSPPDAGVESCAPYTLDIVAALTGVSSQTIVHYREEGLISALPESAPESPCFDDEALRTLRRIEHLRSSCEVNLSGLKLILRLLDEIDQLRSQLSLRR
jgi:MerR family transcriptional regulator/heat shock protein HspR